MAQPYAILRAEQPKPSHSEPAEEQTEEDGELDPALEAAVARLKELSNTAPGSGAGAIYFAKQFLANLDEVNHLAGDGDDDASLKLRHATETLRGRVEAADLPRADRARLELHSHLAWIENNLDDPTDKARAILHAFSTHVDDLDPEIDRDTIAAAQQMFRAANPQS